MRNIFFLIVFFISCQESVVNDVMNIEPPKIHSELLEEFVDERDGNVYKVVKLKNQVWMSENLRYETSKGSYCYEDKIENCLQGRVYTWDAAMQGDSVEGSKGVCPEGWHIPTSIEWDTLIHNIGGDTMGDLLKENGGLHFNAKLNGGRMALKKDSFQYMLRGSDVCFWTSESDSTGAYDRNLNNIDNLISKRFYPKTYGFCVRCIKD